ncbi:hypothetical protein ACMFMF_005167 [Clarireedia jacksonii]
MSSRNQKDTSASTQKSPKKDAIDESRSEYRFGQCLEEMVRKKVQHDQEGALETVRQYCANYTGRHRKPEGKRAAKGAKKPSKDEYEGKGEDDEQLIGGLMNKEEPEDGLSMIISSRRSPRRRHDGEQDIRKESDMSTGTGEPIIAEGTHGMQIPLRPSSPELIISSATRVQEVNTKPRMAKISVPQPSSARAGGMEKRSRLLQELQTRDVSSPPSFSSSFSKPVLRSSSKLKISAFTNDEEEKPSTKLQSSVLQVAGDSKVREPAGLRRGADMHDLQENLPKRVQQQSSSHFYQSDTVVENDISLDSHKPSSRAHAVPRSMRPGATRPYSAPVPHSSANLDLSAEEQDAHRQLPQRDPSVLPSGLKTRTPLGKLAAYAAQRTRRVVTERDPAADVLLRAEDTLNVFL